MFLQFWLLRKIVNIVKSKDGEPNLLRLKKLQEERPKMTVAENAKEEKPSTLTADSVMLTFDQIRFTDFSNDSEPQERILRVGIDHQRFKEVSNPELIGKTIVIATVIEASSREGGMEDLLELAESLEEIAGPEVAKRISMMKEQ